MLDRDSAIPLYLQLSHRLRRMIQAGELPPGAPLPSQRELSERFGVSSITVRAALADLTCQGLIETRVGKGSYVAEAHLSEELRPLGSFSKDIRRRGMTPSSQVLESKTVLADQPLAERLGLAVGEPVVVLRRLRLADDLPVALQTSRLPAERVPGLAHFDFSAKSLYEILRSVYRLDLARGDTHISAALARPAEADLLGLSTPAAVLISQQTTYLADGAPVELSHSVFRADRYSLHVNM